MSAPASLPIFGDAYLADTQHLTLEEHGAYFKLLLCAWRTAACELPADDKRIATMLGISAGKWGKLRPAVMAFWTRTETGWQQKRLTKERKFIDEKVAKNILAANARWNDNPLKTNETGNAGGNANAMPLSPTHLTEEKKEDTPPSSAGEAGDDLPEDDAAEKARLAKLEADQQFRADSISITDEWNAMAAAHGLPRVSALNDERRAKMRMRLDEHGRQAFTEAIGNIAKSPMCRGENSRGWRAAFDFLLQPSSFLKIIEGNYDGTPIGIPHGNRPLGRGGQPQRGGNVRANAAADLYAEAVERERREAEDPVEGGGDYWGTGTALSTVAH